MVRQVGGPIGLRRSRVAAGPAGLQTKGIDSDPCMPWPRGGFWPQHVTICSTGFRRSTGLGHEATQWHAWRIEASSLASDGGHGWRDSNSAPTSRSTACWWPHRDVDNLGFLRTGCDCWCPSRAPGRRPGVYPACTAGSDPVGRGRRWALVLWDQKRLDVS
jgi:hypothetical protein